MFHRYVRNSRGVLIDVDRASFLMDKALRIEALARLDHIRDFDEDADISTPFMRAQHFWWQYTRLHWAKYDRQFSPDAMTEPL